jgi:hypothetical protein
MKTLILAAMRCSLMFVIPTVTYATSAQWDLDPISGDWNTAANWTPNEVPNGPTDIATFGLSNTTDLSISANTEVNAIVFSSAATNPYAIGATNFTLTISGVGIVNNSGTTQNFVTAPFTSGDTGTIVSPIAPRREAMYRSSTVTAQSTSSTRPLLEARPLRI